MIDESYKKDVITFLSELNKIKGKSKDKNVFYNNYYNLLDKCSFQKEVKSSITVDTTVISTIGKFITSTFFKEI